MQHKKPQTGSKETWVYTLSLLMTNLSNIKTLQSAALSMLCRSLTADKIAQSVRMHVCTNARNVKIAAANWFV